MIGQCNNVYIFPGIGLGALAMQATRITNAMFLQAAKIVSTYAPVLEDSYGSLFPPMKHLRKISKEIAIAVGHYAVSNGLCPAFPESVEKRVEEALWSPEYADMAKVSAADAKSHLVQLLTKKRDAAVDR